MGRAAQAVAVEAAAITYTVGRVATNELSWLNAAIVATIFTGAAKILNDDMMHQVNKQTTREIEMVETALVHYIQEMESNLLPKFKDAYPDKPKVAEYEALVPGAELTRSFNERINALTAGNNYIVAYNHMHRVNYITRNEMMTPGFRDMLHTIARQAREMLDGKLPVDEVGEILVDAAEASALRGTIGNMQAMTMRRLGISTLRAQAAGRQALKESIDITNASIPMEGELSSRDLIIQPEVELRMALEQAQLVQQSLQAKYNVEAQKAPYLMGELSARLQMIITRLTFEANKANMGSKFIPDYRGMMAQMTGGLMNKVGEVFAGAFDDSKDHPGGTEQGGAGG